VPSYAYRTQSFEALLLRLRSQLSFDAGAMRQDLRTSLAASVKLEYGGSDLWFVEGRVEGQYTRCFGFNCLIVQGHGIMLVGEVQYWNQPQLAEHLRVFFDNRFWVEEALSLALAFRVALWGERIQAGVFHDLAIFGDRSRGGNASFGVANGFGPSLHFLLFDTFALDLYYGFGFAPGGFDHNMVFKLGKVF